MDAFLVVGENAELSESIGVALRARGHAVTQVSTSADAFRLLRNNPVHTVIVLGAETDAAAAKLRTRVLSEKLASRSILVNNLVRGHGAKREQKFAIGDYRLSESELVAMLIASESQQDSEAIQPTDRAVDALIQVVDVLVGMQELSDKHFRGSSHRAIDLVRRMAELMELPPSEVIEISIAALLKDVGRIGVVDGLLEGTGAYNETQRSRMHEHVNASVRLLEHIDFPWKLLPIIRHHHEKYDGTGYPDGLKGSEIPIGARILSAADCYIALLSDRPHRACFSSSDAQTEMIRGAGTQFDPEIVEILLNAIRGGTTSLSASEKPVVLIADPDVEFIKLLAIRLVNEGVEVRAVTSAEEAILKILEEPPHLVLATTGSDDHRVLHLLQQIREDPDLRLLPFAFLTETDDRIFKVQAFRMGADEVLLKRTDLEELVVRIENMLARDAARRATEVAAPQRGISGDLANLSLPDIFQILSLGQKTARVTLGNGGSEGTIWFDAGATVHSELNDVTGEEACFEMLGWKDGTFCIEHGLTSEDVSIEMDTMMVVMEGLRLADEANAELADLVAD